MRSHGRNHFQVDGTLVIHRRKWSCNQTGKVEFIHIITFKIYKKMSVPLIRTHIIAFICMTSQILNIITQIQNIWSFSLFIFRKKEKQSFMISAEEKANLSSSSVNNRK